MINMKKESFIGKTILSLVLLLIFASPAIGATGSGCDLGSSLINQDPYPALPGEYVEILFQIDGVGDCEEGAVADLFLEYPFSLDGGDTTRRIESPTYIGGDHNYNWNILYKVRIDRDALEGDYDLELRYTDGRVLPSDEYTFDRFPITIEDGRTDFEVHVESYNFETRNLVLEILNIGNQDIEALTIEIPKQENVIIKSSNRNIVGDLDSNEYTTADFEAIPSEGEIVIRLHYTDSTNERRMLGKTVYYDPVYFVDSLENVKPDKTTTYIVVGIIVILGVFLFLRRRKKNKSKKKNKFDI